MKENLKRDSSNLDSGNFDRPINITNYSNQRTQSTHEQSVEKLSLQKMP